MRTLQAKVDNDKYPIFIGENIFRELNCLIETYNRNDIFIICDSYFESLENFLSNELNFIYTYKHIFIDGGIESKTLKTYQIVLRSISQAKIARDGVIVSIGGGVVGDLSAFVASTYQRGIDLIHVPTTTTSMIDSSVGGKTGLNHLDQVNLIGTYFNPKAIFMDLRFLSTLSPRDYYAGLCEAIKMSITSDKEMFDRLSEIKNFVKNRDLKVLEEIIYWSVITKLKHVSGDFKEKSIRLILNYGHTFGQSIETYYGLYQDKLKHGEAVSLGIVVAAKLSLLLSNCTNAKNLLEKTNKILLDYELPSRFKDLRTNDIPEVASLFNNLSNDKKRISEGNRFIICKSIGIAYIENVKNKNVIIDAFKYIYS